MAQVMHQVNVPPGLSPGAQFNATTPDGQQMLITVPEGVRPGDPISFAYVPIAPAPCTATVIGTPVMGQQAVWNTHGQVGYNEYQGYGGRPYDEADMHAGQTGWMCYICAWLSCCCCPPLGLCIWYVVACMHYSKPKAERERRVQEGLVAKVSLLTAIVVSLLGVVLMVLVVTVGINQDTSNATGCDVGTCADYHQVHDDACSCSVYNDVHEGIRRRRRRMQFT